MNRIKLLRDSPAVPRHIKLYGFFYEISSDNLTELVRDIPAWIAGGVAAADVRCLIEAANGKGHHAGGLLVYFLRSSAKNLVASAFAS